MKVQAVMPEQPLVSLETSTSPRPFSLRFRLILLATLVLVVALGLVGMALNSAHYRSAVSSLQARMESYVYLVLAAVEMDDSGALQVQDELGDPRLSQPGSGIYVHVHGSDEHWNSPSAMGLRLPELPQIVAGHIFFREPGGEQQYFSLQYGVGWQLNDGSIRPLTVSVLVDADEIEQQTRAFRLGLWRSLGTAGVILVLAQLLMLFLGFRPLRQVARDVARIESGQAPKLEGRYPRELEPLARNVNRLLETEKSNQQRMRNALDSLAHSLKTPLAVIQAGLELQGGEAAKPMRDAADEMHHLIATRLERARASARRTLAEPVKVRPQVKRVLDSLQKIYSHKMMEAQLIIDENLLFFGEQRDLLELAGNLLDNAFKYGSGKVRVSASAIEPQTTRPGLCLNVEDDGDGIAESQWKRLLQRGTRGDERGTEQVRGHGLGLAIVLELVTAYQGNVSIGRSELGGAMIRVEIPAA
ncbi:MAG: ATP-binding protein [Xanthomonadales bacterium]